jgi:MYXO-CTERM domain-containing protein
LVPAGTAATTGPLWLSNQGPGPVELQQLNLSGDEAGEFSLTGGTSVAGTRLAQGASCSVNLAFQPAAAGARSAMLEVTSSGSSPHAVALSGGGSAAVRGALRMTPTALNLVGAEPQTVTLRNEGNTPLNVTRVAVAQGDFVIDDASADDCQSTAFDLMPGQSCTLQLRAAGAPAGTETNPQTGALEVSTDAAAGPARMKLSASGTADTQVAAAGAVDSSSINSTGGCSIAQGDSAADPVLWLLVLGALAVLALRRREG